MDDRNGLNGFRAVIFDFGGVLTESPLLSLRAFAEETGIGWETLSPLFASHEGAWSRFETNALSEAEFVVAFEQEARATGFRVDGWAFLKAFFGGMALRPEMLAVVRALRRQIKVGCITNNVQTSSTARRPAYEEIFDVVVESSKVGLRKPNPGIYLIACELLGVKPEAAIFLDDFGINLKAARALGITTIKVDETPFAVEELERVLGVELPRLEAGV
ncbi:MAG TPA: HAD family phosphatase [Steroidobacteraceae bacterium]|nr:HAD family phosphatase [Steroidobacteraceae bacterium]